MFASAIEISNYRLYDPGRPFRIDDFNVPDGAPGSGLNMVVGENGCGKTSLLEAIALPLLEYKAEAFSLDDLNDVGSRASVKVEAPRPFTVKKTMPRGEFSARGLAFEGGFRSRSNSSYLSTLCVGDRQFVPVDPGDPKPGSPDLRVSVNNPFSGPRFSESDVLFLDRNRTNQARSGGFGRTRFDRLMEDFDYQYIRSSKPVVNLNERLDAEVKAGCVSNGFLAQAVADFEEMSGSTVHLDFLNNYAPFESAFFAVQGDDARQIPLSRIGSGYEMAFCILYSYYLAKQGGKDLILVLDEPELHLHPSLQQKLMEFLIRASAEAQVFMATHSPLLVKQSMECSAAKHVMLDKAGSCISMEKRVLEYLSGSEVNYLAFGLATAEYHNELYGALLEMSNISGIKDFDSRVLASDGAPKDRPWKGRPNEVTIHTYLDGKGINILALFKRVIGNFSATTAEGSMADCRRFLLDRENRNFPGRYRLFMFAVPEQGAGMLATGWATLFLGPEGAVYYCCRRCSVSRGVLPPRRRAIQLRARRVWLRDNGARNRRMGCQAKIHS